MARPVPNDAGSLSILKNIEGLIEHANHKMDSVCLAITQIEHGINNMVVNELKKQTEVLTHIAEMFLKSPQIQGNIGGDVDSNYETSHIENITQSLKKLESIEENTNKSSGWFQWQWLNRVRARRFSRIYNSLKNKRGWLAHSQYVRNILDDIHTELRLARKSKTGDSGGKSSSAGFDINRTTGEAVETIFGTFKSWIKTARKVRRVERILKVTRGLLDSLDIISKRRKSIKGAGKALRQLSKDILAFGALMAAATPLLLVAVPGIYLTKWVISLITKESMLKKMLTLTKRRKTIKNSGDIMIALAKDMLAFGALMTLATPVLLVSLVGVGLTHLITKMLVHTFTVVLTRKKAKKMERASDSLKDVGVDILLFAGSMALVALLAIPAAIGVLLTLGLITAMTFVISAIPEKEMNRGSRSLLLATVAMVALAGGVFIVGKLVTFEAIGKAALLIGGLALVLGLAGKFWQLIGKGAIAMIFAAVPVAILAWSMKTWMEAKIGWEDIGMLTATILGVGLEMAAAGLAAIFIIPGAIAMAAVGLAIQELAKGLKVWKTVDWDDDDSETLGTTLGGLTAAFAQAGGEPANPGGLFGAVFGNAFSPNAVERGIDSVMGAGSALIDIAKGLIEFKKLIDSGIDFSEGGSMETAISNTLGFVSSAFSKIGQDEVSDSWLIFEWDENNVAKGIDAVKGAGKELTQIAKGLMSFQKMIDKDIDFSTGGKLETAVKNSLAFVAEAFKSIGNGENEESDGWFIFSWDENVIAKGIDAVKGAGTELTNIAKGLASFQELVEKEIDFSKGGKLEQAVKNSITFVGEAFASIGNGENEEKDGWFIFSWDENVIQKGVESVSGAGAELTNIAEGLKSFQELVEKDIDWNILGNAIKNSLTFVGDAFAVIGGKEESDGWFVFSWDENLVQKGIKNVAGAGAELTNIAEGLKVFSSIIEPEKVGNSIKSMLSSILGVFDMASSEKAEKQVNLLGLFTGYITDLSEYIDEVDKLADSFERIAESMESVKESINNTELEKLTKYSDVLFNLGTVMEKSQEQQLTGFVDGISDAVGGALSSIGSVFTSEEPATNTESNIKNTDNPINNKEIIQTLNQLILEMQSVDSALRGVITVENKGNPFGGE